MSYTRRQWPNIGPASDQRNVNSTFKLHLYSAILDMLICRYILSLILYHQNRYDISIYINSLFIIISKWQKMSSFFYNIQVYISQMKS